MGQSSIQPVEGAAAPARFSWTSHLGAHRKRWARVGELPDSSMSGLLFLWASGVLLRAGFVRAEGLQGGRAVQAQGQLYIGDCLLWSSLARASQIPASLRGGFKGPVQCFCLVSWQQPEISAHLLLRLYNFPSDLVPKLSSFCKAAQLSQQPSPALATIRHPKQGSSFISLELHILRGPGEKSTGPIALLLGVPPA